MGAGTPRKTALSPIGARKPNAGAGCDLFKKHKRERREKRERDGDGAARLIQAMLLASLLAIVTADGDECSVGGCRPPRDPPLAFSLCLFLFLSLALSVSLSKTSPPRLPPRFPLSSRMGTPIRPCCPCRARLQIGGGWRYRLPATGPH